MKRILYFHHGGGIGGAPLSLLYLLRQLDRQQYEPIVVTTRPGPVVDLYRGEGIETYVCSEVPGGGPIDDFSHTTLEWYNHTHWWPLPARIVRFGPAITYAQRIVEHFQPDLVHLNSSTLAAAGLGTKRTGVPVVWHIREPLARGYLGLRRAWLRDVIDRVADKVVCISEYDKSLLKSPEKITVVHNFVDFKHFDRALSGDAVRAELGIAADSKIVLMLGGASPPKGTHIFLQALEAVLAQQPDALFVIAGPSPHNKTQATDTPLRSFVKWLLNVDAYNKRIVRLLDKSPSGKVMFTGIRRDIPQVLAASDVLVFPSTVPHFARPVIEAAAMAKPAIASNLGGPAELIADGETGLLVPANNPGALADAIADVLSDPARAQAMGEAGYARARAMFDAETNAAATLVMYKQLLQNPRIYIQ